VTGDDLAAVLRAPWTEADVTSLRNAIYLRAFARELTGDSFPASSVSAADLARQLSAANQGRDRWASGWRIERIAENGGVVAVSGNLRRSFSSGEYSLTFTERLPPRVGMAATVLFVQESLTMQPGVYYAFGDSVPDVPAEDDGLRAYFHSPEGLLPDLYFHLTGQLNRLEIPFTLKTLLAPHDRDRSDATVLYVPREHRSRVELLLREMPPSLLSRMRPRTPLFTLPLAPGIGMAESPGGGESFGMHRSRLVAEGILDARREGKEDEQARLQAVNQRFRAAGIDPAHPHVTRRAVLSETNVADWLRGRGLISTGNGATQWRVRTHTSRNRNFAILRDDGSGFFVKQLRVQDSESLRMMEREAAMYELFASCGSPLRDIAATFRAFDRDSQVLIFELESEAERGFITRPASDSTAFATAAAHTLALLHRQQAEHLIAPSHAGLFDRRPPGIYSVHRGGPLLRWLGTGQLRLVERMRNHGAMAAALDQMFADWQPVRLIHGDVKWENCVWREKATGARLTWIDWELADVGDPSWDAGCFVHGYLLHWARNERRAEVLAAMQPAMKAFFTEYIAALGTGGPETAGLKERIMSCAAARMFQMGLEVMHGRPEPTPEAVGLLEASADIMARPENYFGA
jgi:hypothetical protein